MKEIIKAVYLLTAAIAVIGLTLIRLTAGSSVTLIEGLTMRSLQFVYLLNLFILAFSIYKYITIGKNMPPHD